MQQDSIGCLEPNTLTGSNSTSQQDRLVSSVPPEKVSELRLLADAHVTPFYVYDMRVLSEQYAEFAAAFPHPWFKLYFATMANDRSMILKHLASLGVGACVNSVAHLELALESGFPPSKIQYSSTGISRADMKRLLTLGIHLNVDSLQQLEQWATLGGVTAGLRLNAASLSSDRAKDRIGMCISDLVTAQTLSIKRGLKVSGLHVYIGTNLQSHDQLLPTVDRLFQLAEKFNEIEYLNIGGGVGVNYRHCGRDFDLPAYGAAISKYQKRLSLKLGRNVQVILEPGRKLTASCGRMVTKITDVKFLHNRRYVAVDASVAIFPRPLLHPETPHHIWMLPEVWNHDNEPKSEAVVVGRTTFSGDILGNASLPENLKVGDVLVFDDAGSYSQSMETRFLGQPSPASVFIDENGSSSYLK